MKKVLAAVLAASLLILPAGATVTGAPEVSAGAAVLMEKETGEVLYQQNPHDKLEPASVTKVMTMLLVMEAMDAGLLSPDETVRVSARAASMGGSQVYLEEGETQDVETMIKCIVIASGNDASVAMAEHIAGSEQEFVKRMNERAVTVWQRRSQKVRHR